MITVDLHRADLAEVTITPTLLRRVLFGATTETRWAVRVLVVSGGYGWSWDHCGRRIDDPAVLVEIDRAVNARRRRGAMSTSGVEPPS